MFNGNTKPAQGAVKFSKPIFSLSFSSPLHSCTEQEYRVGPGNQELLHNYNARWVGSDVRDKPGKNKLSGCGSGGLEWHTETLDLTDLGIGFP